MHKQLFRLLFCSIMLAVAYGCTKDDSEIMLATSSNTIELTYTGQANEITISTSGDWLASTTKGDTWCIISPYVRQNGNGKLRISAEENLSPLTRSTTITIEYGESQSTNITVVQTGRKSTRSPYEESEIRVYEQNKESKAATIMFIGDGFTQADYIDGGTFDAAVQEAAEALFKVEPYKTYRKYFNIYKMAAFSEQRGASHKDQNVTRKTAFNTTYTGGSAMNCNTTKVFEYAAKLPGSRPTETAIILIVNDGRYGGTTWMENSGRSVAMCPMNRGTLLPAGFGSLVIHEAGGHGFGRLGDEYTNSTDATTTPSQETLNDIKKWSVWGYYQNIDITSDPTKVKWSNIIGQAGYSAVGVYEGAFNHEKGVWRSEQISCMDDNRPYFNAPSRMAIVRRIKSIAGEVFTLSNFIENDKVKVSPATISGRSAITDQMPRLASPIMVEK